MQNVTSTQVYEAALASPWNTVLGHCERVLKQGDRLASENVKDAESFRSMLTKLQSENLEYLTFQALESLHWAIPHLKTCTDDFVTESAGTVDVSFMWEILSLFIQLALKVDGAIINVSRLLRQLGHDVRTLNEYRDVTRNINTGQFAKTSTSTNVELIKFFLFGVKVFREGPFVDLEKEVWLSLMRQYDETRRNIKQWFDWGIKVERLLSSTLHSAALSNLQKILLLSNDSSWKNAQIPCRMLPSEKNPLFFNRVDVFQRIEKCLRRGPSPGAAITSVALYGLGGVGKSSVALQYAHSKLQDYRVVLWLCAETAVTLAQSFSDAVMKLKLPHAKAHSHTENRVLLLSWLQGTSKFLLVFDNVEDPDILSDYWPIGGSGDAIVTTRHQSLSYVPCGAGIEISTLAAREGSTFLVPLVDKSENLHVEDSILELSNRLSGHALAIYQLAGLFQNESWAVADFVKMYDKNAARGHHSSHGNDSLKTIWHLTFDSLDKEALKFLGVLAFMDPDSIPQELFESEKLRNSNKAISYWEDNSALSEVVESLVDSALIKRNMHIRAFSIHRLVQTEFRYQLKKENLQESFDDASRMLYEAFPKQQPGESMLQEWHQCSVYLGHVQSLTVLYTRYRKDLRGFLPIIEFCQLLGNCATYMVETSSFQLLHPFIKVAFDALELCKLDETRELTYAHFCNSLGLMKYFCGNFTGSISFFEKAGKIRCKLLPQDNGFVTEIFSNLGNAYTSKGNLQVGMSFHEKRCATVGQLGPQAQAQNNLNIAVNLYLLGKVGESKKSIADAVRTLEKIDNKWMLMSNSFLQSGNVHRREGNLVAAKQSYEAARNQIVNIGNVRSHQMIGVYLYKLGVIALDQGEVDQAMQVVSDIEARKLLINHSKYLREASDVCASRLIHVDQARVLFKLSQALRQKNPEDPEAEIQELEAISVAKEILKSAYVEGEKTEEDYDMLVCALAR